MLNREEPHQMSEGFEITESEWGGVPIVSVTGEIDVATAPPLRDCLHARVSSGQATVIVDLLDVTFLDSTALGVLVGALKRCRETGGDLFLVINKPRILRVFEITGLTEVFTIRSTVEAAGGNAKTSRPEQVQPEEVERG
jgi:anti-sigma B factor antagonist